MRNVLLLKSPNLSVVTEKAFDKAFQLEDNVEANGEIEVSENGEQTTTTLIESKKNFRSNNTAAGGGGGSGVEPLSLPSVVGSKALFSNANNAEHGKQQGYFFKLF